MPPGLLHAGDLAVWLETDQPRADVDRGRSTTLPSAHTAIFEVPPPTSTFITTQPSRIERAAAPEP